MAMNQMSMSTQACQRCWRRKEKCDRLIPSCSKCTRAGTSCVQRIWGRVVSEDIEPDAVTSQSFVATLKYKITLLENKLVQTQDASPLHATSPDVSPRNRQSDGHHSRVVEDIPQGQDEQSMGTAADEAEYLSRFAMSGLGGNNDSTTTKIGPAELFPIVLNLSGRNPGLSTLATSPSSQYERLRNIFSAISTLDMPSALERCQKSLLLEWPLIDHESCIETFELVKQAHDDAAFDQLCQQAPHKFVKLGVVTALSSAVGTPGHLGSALVATLVDAVTATNQRLAKVESDLVVIKSLLLQSLLSLYFPEASSTWHLVGLATTKAISLGIHQGLETDNDDDSDVRKERQLIFWVIYCFDRTLAFSMDRPFALEDFDLTSTIPSIVDQTDPSTTPPKDTLIHCWVVHYMHMLSQWRRDTVLDFETCFAGYQYWHSVFKELSKRLKRDDDSTSDQDQTIPLYLNKFESQLSCRALVQLLNKAFLTPLQPSLDGLHSDIIREVPQFVNHLKAYNGQQGIMLTFLDAYDLFVAILTFLYASSRPPVSLGLATRSKNVYRPSIADMRVLMTCIELLQSVAKRFIPMEELAEILWKLLAALEEPAQYLQDRHSGPNSHTAQITTQHLYTQIHNCSLPFPRLWRRIIDACLDRN